MRKHNLDRLDDLVLARLAVRSTRPPTTTVVSRSLYAFVASDLREGEWSTALSQALARLREQGLIDPERLLLTQQGQARLLAALRLRALPPATTWAQLQRKYLPRLFLDPAQLEGELAPDCAAAVLAERLGVPCTARSTARQIVDAWLAKTLGLDSFGLEQIRNVLLARELGLPRRKSAAETLRLGIAHVAGAPNARSAAVTAALVTRWLRAEAPPPSESAAQANVRPAADDLGDFVARVKAAAGSKGVRSYGDNKVFIGSVWQLLSSDPEIGRIGEAGFKSRLIEAHRQGALVLGRADLVAAMDPHDVRASEIQHQNATYHFIHRGQPA